MVAPTYMVYTKKLELNYTLPNIFQISSKLSHCLKQKEYKNDRMKNVDIHEKLIAIKSMSNIILGVIDTHLKCRNPVRFSYINT